MADPVTLAGILGSDGTSLVGEAAKLTFRVDLGANPPERLRIALAAALESEGLREEIERKMDARVKKKFSDRYTVEDLDVVVGDRTISASVTTLYDDQVDLRSIAKKVAAACASIRDDLADLIEAEIDARPSVRARWAQGEGLFDPSRLLSPDTPEPQLDAHLFSLKTRRKRLIRVRLSMLLAALFFTAIAVPLAFNGGGVLAALYVGAYAAIALFGAIVLNSQVADLDADIRDIANELDLRRIATQEYESRAQKLLQAHSFELKRYYDQALRQGRTIYFVGFACLFLGFAVIAGALYFVFNTDADSSEKLILGALGAIGGILANYIAVVYLRMFSKTIHALTGFHQRLVMTHHLHFGNFLTSKITDRTLREESLAAMAEALSSPNGAEPEAVPEGE